MGKVIILTLMLMLLVAVTPVTGEPIRVTQIGYNGCDSNTRPDVEFMEDFSSLEFWCYGSDFTTSTATLEWTLDNSSGQRLVLGTCYGDNNCTSVYNSTVLTVRQYTTSVAYPTTSGVYPYSVLYLSRIGHDVSGTLTCTETLKDGTTNSTTCRITVKRAHIPAGDVYNAVEGGNSSITCYFPAKALTPSVVSWTLHTSSGQTLDYGNCSAENNCTTSHVSRSYNYRHYGFYFRYNYSVVIITNVARYKTGQLTCSFSYSGVVYSDSTQLHVYSKSYSVENCTAVVERENWTVAVSCDVDHLFSTSGSYEIAVHNSREELERRSFSNKDMTQYTDVTGKQFYRGRLFYFWKLPAVPYEYWYFGVRVYNGETINETSIASRVIVASPATPAINCSGFTAYIPENVTCVCTVDNLGSPEGRLRWLLGDTVMATGPYGVKSLELPPWKMTRQQDGLTLFCQVDWIEKHNTPMVTRVIRVADVDTNKSLKEEAARMKWIAVALGVVLVVVVVAVIVAVVVIKCRKSKPLHLSTVVKSKPKPVPQSKIITQSKIVTYV